jgi:hypothetical protein
MKGDSMDSSLKKFLACDDLDDLLSIKVNLRQLVEDDQKLIRDILVSWSDQQAVANLLFHPDVIPETVRCKYILKALRETRVEYYALAAIVGLQTMRARDFSESERRCIVRLLTGWIEIEDEVIAPRAAIAIADYLGPDEISTVRGFLRSGSKIIRHNILVAIIGLIGLEASRAVIESLLHNEDLPVSISHYLNQQLAAIGDLLLPQPQDRFNLLMSDLGAPVLTYIPNLRDNEKIDST